mmetsp:Transcript_91378/g.185993  ORF Transcript_91378/g.185993 Transcript_91378/m.185993 type:complete len:188 (+) Transcript_91378:1883-2446(+)
MQGTRWAGTFSDQAGVRRNSGATGSSAGRQTAGVDMGATMRFVKTYNEQVEDMSLEPPVPAWRREPRVAEEDAWLVASANPASSSTRQERLRRLISAGDLAGAKEEAQGRGARGRPLEDVHDQVTSSLHAMGHQRQELAHARKALEKVVGERGLRRKNKDLALAFRHRMRGSDSDEEELEEMTSAQE